MLNDTYVYCYAMSYIWSLVLITNAYQTYISSWLRYVVSECHDFEFLHFLSIIKKFQDYHSFTSCLELLITYCTKGFF